MADDDPLQLLMFPDSRLRIKCKPVKAFDRKLLHLTRDMLYCVRKWGGLGLAAPQVGAPIQMFVAMMNVKGNHYTPIVAVNPMLELDDDELYELGEEGCLSIPGERRYVERSRRVQLLAHDEHGNPFTAEYHGLNARVIQHEYDHLFGRLIVDQDGHDGKGKAKPR